MDRCVLCGKETPYDSETHIDNRQYYVEGAGQLCEDCHHKINPPLKESGVGFPRTLICPYCNTPNNGEGEADIVQCHNCSRKFNN